MRSRRSRIAMIGVLALAASVTVGLVSGSVADAKKKTKKAGGIVIATVPVNAAIPDGTATTNGVLTSTTVVGGKKFKSTQVRDVNATVQTTGAGAGAAGDLFARLTAPNGATTTLFFGLSGQSVGPLTLDDETPFILGGLPPAPDPQTLVAPYVGTAAPNSLVGLFSWPLSVMDGGPASGTWTLRVYDGGTGAGHTSVLNSWTPTVVAGKPFKT
jgi:hypothetical protein